MVNVLFFGLKLGEMSQMRSSIEYAFDVYRNKLAAFMLNINSVLRRMDQVDCFTDKLKTIHDQYRTLVKSIPVCWEHNEMMLRSLTNSNNFDLIYSILPFNSNTIYSHQTDAETTRKDSPESVSSYNSLEQLVIHLNRDWGVKGVELRDALYKDGIIALLQELTEQQTQRNNGENTHNQPLHLLLPGGGLGRLAVELSALNYSVEMNECSATMVTSFHSIVRILNKQGQQQTQQLKQEHRETQQQQSMQPDALFDTAFENTFADSKASNTTSSSNNSTGTSTSTSSNYFFPYLNFPLVDDWDFGARFEREHYPHIEDSLAVQTFFAQYNSNGSSDNSSDINSRCNSSGENKNESNREQSNSKHNSSTTTTADNTSTYTAPLYSQIPAVSPLSVQFGEFVEVYGRSNDHAGRFDLVVTCFFIDTASSIFEYLAVIAHVLKPGGLWINAGPLHYHSQEAIPYSHSYMLQVIGTAGFDLLSEKSVRTSYCGDDHINMKPEMYNIPVNAFKFNRPEEKYPINIKKSIQNAYNNSGVGEHYNNSTNSDSSSNSIFSDLDYIVKS